VGGGRESSAKNGSIPRRGALPRDPGPSISGPGQGDDPFADLAALGYPSRLWIDTPSLPSMSSLHGIAALTARLALETRCFGFCVSSGDNLVPSRPMSDLRTFEGSIPPQDQLRLSPRAKRPLSSRSSGEASEGSLFSKNCAAIYIAGFNLGIDPAWKL